MEEIFGFIDSILFAEEENGYVVARVKEPKKKDPTVIIGIMPGVHIGESITCKGTWKLHPKFGQQFEVKGFETRRPTEAVGIQRYLESGMIKGIGPKFAERIVKKFGIETLTIIDTAPEKLLQVEGVGEKKLEKILTCWKEQREVRNVMLFLRGNGISPSYAQKIFKAYGQESIQKMEENPFRIAQEIRGIGFKTADLIAHNLGVQKDAPQRISSGIQHVLWELSNEGHVCYPKDELLVCAHEMLAVPPEKVLEQIEVLKNEKTIVEEKGNVWIKPLYLTEVGIARQLQRLMKAPCILRHVDVPKALEWVQSQLKITLAEQQAEGVAKAVSEKVLILTGGPGTGKSTITNAILRILEKLTKKILLAAPTGRAAKRMSEITHRKAFTIHSLLEMDFKEGGFKRGLDNPLKCDVLIVDEASMIDTQLMYSLLKAIPETARLIIVGDTDQLPSVGPGNVLRDMIEAGSLPVVRLTEVFRQAKGSHIITNAHRINQGLFPWLEGEKDFRFMQADTAEDIKNTIIRLVSRDLPQFDRLKQIQVLSPMKRGVVGTENLNDALQAVLNPCHEALLRMGRRFHPGDKVMQLRNNYQKEVFNGDVGFIKEIDLQEQLLTVSYYERIVEYDFSELDEIVLAYAVSVHKYQGSESQCIIIPMDTSHFKLLYRNLLYTAITRGRKLVILVGSKQAIGIAVRTEEVQKRHTGLIEKIKIRV